MTALHPRASDTKVQRTAGVLMAAYLLVVAAIVFWPSADVASGSVSTLWSILERLGAPEIVTPALVEFGTNVLLFVPLGFLGCFVKPRWPWTSWVAIGFAGTLFIETVQWLLLTGRSPEFPDIVANTLGALVGALLGRLTHPMLR